MVQQRLSPNPKINESKEPQSPWHIRKYKVWYSMYSCVHLSTYNQHASTSGGYKQHWLLQELLQNRNANQSYSTCDVLSGAENKLAEGGWDTHNNPPPDITHKPAITSQRSLSYSTTNGELT